MRSLLLLLALSVLLAACSETAREQDEPDESNPMQGVSELAEINDHLDHPDGTLSPDAIASFYPTGLDDRRTIDLDFSELLQVATPITIGNCPGFDAKASKGTCKCPAGGSFTYRVERTTDANDDTLFHVVSRRTFSDCKMRDESGSLAGKFFNHRYLRERSGSHNEQNAYDLTLTKGAERYYDRRVTRFGRETTGLGDGAQTIDVGLRDSTGWITWIVNPADSGSVTAVDREGRWTCDETGDSATCTRDGDSRKISRD